MQKWANGDAAAAESLASSSYYLPLIQRVAQALECKFIEGCVIDWKCALTRYLMQTHNNCRINECSNAAEWAVTVSCVEIMASCGNITDAMRGLVAAAIDMYDAEK